MRYKWLIIYSFLLVPFFCKAQYVFDNLQVKDGLSANEVMCVYKDSDGFMWFGTTNGLDRYDGSSFKIFRHSINNPNTPASEIITAIIESKKGEMLFGSSHGLSSYDKETGNFQAVPFINEKNESVNDLYIERLSRDPMGHLWIFTSNGVSIYSNGRALPVSSVFTADSGKLTGLACITGGCMIDTIHHGYWISIDKGLKFMNYQTGEIYSAQNNPFNWPMLNEKNVESLAVDLIGNIWVSGGGWMLAYFDFNSNKLTEVKKFVISSKLFEHVPPSHRLAVDSKNRLWLGTWYFKTIVREPDGTFIMLPDQSPTQYRPGYGYFHDFYEDNEGNIWLATLNGVSKIRASNPLINIYNLPNYKKTHEIGLVNAMLRINENELMLAKEDGLYIFNEQLNKGTRYFVHPTDLQANRFFAIAKIEDEYWCGSGRGIQIFNPVTKKFRPFTHYPGNKVIMHSVFWIFQDSRKVIWYAAWADAIYRYNPQTGETIRFDGTDKSFGEIALTNSLCVIEDSHHRLWFGEGSSGVRIFEYETGKFRRIKNRTGTLASLDKLIVNSILEDKQHNIWLATNGKGIIKVDIAENCLDSFTVENGLSSNNVIGLFMDSSERIWAATTEGLHYLNRSTSRISKINLDIQLPFGDTWSFSESKGKLYVAAMDKLAVFNISKQDEKIANPSPLISGVSVFEKEIPFSSVSPRVQLRYDENFFVIEFSSPHHKEISSLQYAYKLEGFDKDWVYCGRRQAAAYTNVPNGRYSFLVKCTDANGQWEKSETRVAISIKPPFWKTWWFMLCVILVIAWGGWRIYRFNRQRRQKQYIDKTIDYFANSVYGQNSVNEICWDIARNCISQLQFEDCVVYLFNEEKNRLVQKAAYGPKNPKGHEIVNPIEIEPGKGIVGTVAATGKPLLISDTTKDPRYIVDDEMRYSEIAVPILHDNEVIGVIDSEHSTKNYFTPEHMKALSTIASISANKIAEAIAEAQVTENEIKVLEINKMLAESQLMALRAQMNPHFVFNCLNSIQECIVTEKYGEASKYLNKFSKLFRMVLNNSGKNLVTIDEEKEVLDLYLELEQMRFEKSFSWEIIVDEELETDEMLIPSMLLQPYVENALWHGLMHKEGDRCLKIEFKKLNEDVFRCVIEDNGIGRKKSFELKEQQSKTKRHESKGLKISKDRLDVLEHQGYHATLEILDKPAGTGTIIIIELSTFLKN